MVLKKHHLVLISLILFLFGLNSPVLAAPSVQVNDKQLSFDVPPVLENGRTLVPLRAIFEAFGAKVAWDTDTQTIDATYDSKHLTLIIGSPVGYVNGIIIPMDAAPQIVEGRTLVPLRFVSEALGFNVNWDEPTQMISIKTSHDAVYDDNDWTYITDSMGEIVCTTEIDNEYILMGNYYITSEENQGEYPDLGLIDLDYSGYLVEEEHFGDPLYNEIPLTFAATQDDCCIFSFIITDNYESVYCLAKFNQNETIWDFYLPCDFQSATDTVQTSDGAYAFVIEQANGLITSNHLIKINSEGKQSLDKVLGNEEISSICASSDGGLVMVGQKESPSDEEQTSVFILKTDNRGNIQWSNAVGDEYVYEPSCIAESSEGYVITGRVISSEQDSRAFVMKIDKKGNLQWEKYYGGSNYSEAFWICKTKDNGFVFTGSTEYDEDDPDFWLVKIDSQGNILFDKRFGSENEDTGLYVEETSDGGIIASGYIDGILFENTKGFVVKTDANGEIH